MACNHEHLKCTDNVFYCLDCGAEVPNPNKQEEKPAEEKKTTPKRRAKKGAAEK